MAELILNGRRIADDAPPYVIAEIGHNHQGDLALAQKMIRVASDCGADACKFQKRDNATLYSDTLLNQPYCNEASYGPTYGAHRAALEFEAWQYRACLGEAQRVGIACFATAFDEPSADFLEALHVPAFKVHSGGLTDHRLLDHIASFGKPVILSTGGGTAAYIDRAVHVITEHHTQVALLHCTAAYPVRDFSELNLRCILTLKARYPEFVIGWSGHDSGIAMALVAYAFGARILEKHFTLNRANKGTDHPWSLEPTGLTKLVRDLQRAHVALGDGVKRWYDSERKPIAKMRRTLQEDGRWQVSGQ